LVLADIDSSLLLKVSLAEIDEFGIEIDSTKMGVTVGSFYFKDTLRNGDEGDIKSTTSKIEDDAVLFFFRLFIKTISNCSSSWLINDSKNIETCDGCSILGSLSLRIIEICWDSDDSRFDILTKERISEFLQFYQNHG
jgi:hypothetical protein